METNTLSQGRIRRTLDDLIIAELFLVQATIESATAIGEGLSVLGRQIATGDEEGTAPADSISSSLQSIANGALEPYTSRLKYMRLISKND